MGWLRLYAALWLWVQTSARALQPRAVVTSSLPAAIIRQTILGLLLVLVSLPFLWILHRSFGLGSPPITGILTLGGAVVLTFAGAGAMGAFIGQTHGNAFLAAILTLLLGGFISASVAPLYGSMIVHGLTLDATGMVWAERDRITGGAQTALKTRAGQTFDAARQGRLREQLSQFQTEAKTATSSAARMAALQKAEQTALELANLSREKGIGLLKSGVARSSAFALLIWTILGAPLGAAFEAKRARRF